MTPVPAAVGAELVVVIFIIVAASIITQVFA